MATPPRRGDSGPGQDTTRANLNPFAEFGPMTDLIAAAPQWLLAIGGVLGMALVGLIVHAVLYSIAARVAQRTNRPLNELFVRHSRRPARLLIPLALAMMAWRSVPRDAAWAVSGERLLGMFFIVGIAWLLIAMAKMLAGWAEIRFPVDVAENLQARRIRTQAQIFRRTASTIISGLALALILMKIPGVENVGASLLASAGIAGIVVGMAARPALSNLLAGLQLALTQPIRLDDVVIVEGEWGRIEEITNTYVVVKIWDLRRLVVPLSHFIEHPFQNWTRSTSKVLGTVFINVDYTMPIEPVREALHRILQSTPLWDGDVWNLQVVESTDRTLQLRGLMSASDAGRAWDLRCHVRERLVQYLCDSHPLHLPRIRAELNTDAVSADRPPLVERNEHHTSLEAR